MGFDICQKLTAILIMGPKTWMIFCWNWSKRRGAARESVLGTCGIHQGVKISSQAHFWNGISNGSQIKRLEIGHDTMHVLVTWIFCLICRQNVHRTVTLSMTTQPVVSLSSYSRGLSFCQADDVSKMSLIQPFTCDQFKGNILPQQVIQQVCPNCQTCCCLLNSSKVGI